MKIVIAKPCCGTCKHFKENSGPEGRGICGATSVKDYIVSSENLSCFGKGFEWWTMLGMEIDVPEEVYKEIHRETRYREVKDRTL